jgi:hypothetical protein
LLQDLSEDCNQGAARAVIISGLNEGGWGH